MNFNVSPVVTRDQYLEVLLADLRPSRDLRMNISSAQKLIRCAKGFGVEVNFNEKMKNRNPGIYAAAIFKSPEVSM